MEPREEVRFYIQGDSLPWTAFFQMPQLSRYLWGSWCKIVKISKYWLLKPPFFRVSIAHCHPVHIHSTCILFTRMHRRMRILWHEQEWRGKEKKYKKYRTQFGDIYPYVYIRQTQGLIDWLQQQLGVDKRAANIETEEGGSAPDGSLNATNFLRKCRGKIVLFLPARYIA